MQKLGNILDNRGISRSGHLAGRNSASSSQQGPLMWVPLELIFLNMFHLCVHIYKL